MPRTPVALNTVAPGYNRCLSLLTVAALLAGCSAGGSTPVGQVPFVAARAPFAAPASRRASKLKVTLRIRVPAKTRAHRARYVSPSTQSMTIDVTGTGSTASPAGYPRTINLTPTSNGCTAESGGTVCTLAFALAAGTYAAAIATYDQTGGTGHLLSQEQTVAFTVATGKANTVAVSLGGIPASIVATPLAPGYLAGSASGLTLYGPAAQPLIVETLDADGNVIAGSGAPAIVVRSSSTGIATVSAGADPNVFELQAPSNPVTPGTLTLDVTATPASGSGGSAITAQILLRVAHSAVYVSTCGTSCSASGSDAVYVFYDGNAASPSLTITSGVNSPEGLAVDAYGTLYVANISSDNVTKYPAGSTTASATITNGVDEPIGLALNSSGTLFVANGSNNTVTEYPPGATTATTTLNGFDVPTALAIDAADTLYVANESSDTVTEYLSGSYGTLDRTLTGLSAPAGIALDAAGTLYASNQFGFVAVEEYATGASTPTAMLSLPDQDTADGLAIDAAGVLYVAAGPDKEVLEYPAGSSSPTVTIPPSVFGGRRPAFIAVVPPVVAP